MRVLKWLSWIIGYRVACESIQWSYKSYKESHMDCVWLWGGSNWWRCRAMALGFHMLCDIKLMFVPKFKIQKSMAELNRAVFMRKETRGPRMFQKSTLFQVSERRNHRERPPQRYVRARIMLTCFQPWQSNITCKIDQLTWVNSTFLTPKVRNKPTLNITCQGFWSHMR